VAANELVVSHREVVRGSERSFGLVLAAVFTIIGCIPLLRGHSLRLWALELAIVFFAAAILFPRVLAPFNRAWFRFGLLLHSVVTPVMMAVIFYGAVVPMAVVLRARGRDLLRLKLGKATETYWIVRPPGPTRGSMSKQF
jgi:Saxitoxin biosynthesis operon protein SxtJ